MFLLDTNVVSELRKKPGKLDANVLAWSKSIHPLDQYLSVVTIQELETGILLLHRRDPTQAKLLRHWLQAIVRPSFSKRILPVTEEIALSSAQLHVPNPQPYRDALIAATASVHNLTIVTRNVADFSPMGVRILNPWLASSEEHA